MSLFDLGPAPFYVPPTDRRDEMVDPSGTVRSAWEGVHSTLLASGGAALRRDASRIQRRLHSHGAAFAMNSGDHRHWRLDPVPMVVERSEWSILGRALVQRARVLEAVLADVFGEQRLLRSGLLPIDAVVSHRDYLRPCIGIPPGGGRHLVMYAADVARLPDGSFRVIADRTQAPSGAGYTLENREVLSATYPDLLRTSGVEPLRPWFSALRLTLAEVAPPGVDDPRIVILTPGPLSETYFEHGFLSRALGYTLVEPADLTVRDGHVWLKSVTGLEPVHVILRRQDAEWCDSLELRSDSLLGVPGLVEAARRRNVSIVNPLGSGLTENPALLPSMGALTRALLDEDPLIESAPTWWCGDPAARSHVLANLERLVVKPVNRGRGRQSTFGRLLTRSQRDELAAAITAQPHLFVGQEEQMLTTAPALEDAAIVPRYAVLRSFLVADANGFVWMDGGLTRTADHPVHVTMSSGGTSKDTWVVAPPSEHSWVARRAVALPQVDLRDSVTASSAASMFWIGRNLERAETIIRVVRSIDEALGLWPELRDEGDGGWVTAMGAGVVALMHDEGDLPTDLHAQLDAVSVRALGDPHLSRSLTTSLRYLVQGGRSVRERLSTDAWRMLSELEMLQPRLDGAAPVEARELAEATIAPLSALSGLVMESMVRDPGWRFLDLGRRIERAELLCTLLRATVVPPSTESVTAPLLEAVLAGWDCLGAYRRRHRSDVERPAMLALLLGDGGNPRSLRFQVERLAADAADLPTSALTDEGLSGHVGPISDLLGATTVGELSRIDDRGRLEALDEFLARVLVAIDRLAESTELGYFAQVGPGTVLGDDSRGGTVRFHVVHTTRYRYSSPASLCYNLAHLTPRATLRQRVTRSEVVIEPRPDDRSARVDEHGNLIEYFTIERPHSGLCVTATSELVVEPYDISPAAHRSWEETRDAVIDPTPEREFLLESPLVPALAAVEQYAAPSFPPGRSLLASVQDLTNRIFRDFSFQPGATTVSTPLSEVLEQRNGVCQDFAHLAVGCLRSMGLAARYVSGYLETSPPPGQDKLIGADATHAWCAVRLADGSWLDLDPTNDAVGPDNYLVVVWGRDYGDVVPVKGVVMSANDAMELSVAVDVVRLADPTVDGRPRADVEPVRP